MRRNHLLSLITVLALAACRDDGVGPREPASPVVPTIGKGYIIGRYREPVQVTFEVVGGRAIVEGDIDVGPADLVATSAEQLRKTRPSGDVRLNSIITGTQFRWPGGVVPYEIDPLMPDSGTLRVINAMKHVSGRVPGVNFVERTPTESSYVYFEASTECSSHVGRQTGRQIVRLANECTTGDAVHELGHVLGLWHEQSRCDRDQYVEIIWSNIIEAYKFAFAKHCASTDPYSSGTDIFSYDLGSIMHYKSTAFSQNGLPTIQPINGSAATMGQRYGLSNTDIQSLNWMYPLPRRRACCS